MSTPKETPKYLIQKFPRKGIARLFLRTDALASRPDMSPYAGPVPASMEVKLDEETGVVTAVVASADPHASALLEEKAGVDDQAQAQVQTLAPATENNVVVPEPGKAVGPAGTGEPDGDAKALATGTGPDGGGVAGEEKALDLTPKYTPEEKHAKLVEEIGKLDPANEEHYTKGGDPRIDPLMLALGGVDVSAQERDAAFAEYQKKKAK